MPDKVVSKIELGVCHILDYLESTVGLAPRHQLQTMLERHQRVLRPMDNQQRTHYLPTVLLIVESLLQHRPRAPTVQILGYLLQRNEGTQQDSSIDCKFPSNSQCHSTADGPSEEYNLINGDSIGQQELQDSHGINLNVPRGCFPRVAAIASIFHC